jgi:hypothetical protein
LEIQLVESEREDGRLSEVESRKSRHGRSVAVRDWAVVVVDIGLGLGKEEEDNPMDLGSSVEKLERKREQIKISNIFSFYF